MFSFLQSAATQTLLAAADLHHTVHSDHIRQYQSLEAWSVFKILKAVSIAFFRGLSCFTMLNSPGFLTPASDQRRYAKMTLRHVEPQLDRLDI